MSGRVSVKSSVVLNLLLSGQVFPGRPVSRPMKWTSIVGIAHDCVARGDKVLRGADRAGRAKRESVRACIFGCEVN